jgi:putative ABC transport system ATP-binding protein
MPILNVSKLKKNYVSPEGNSTCVINIDHLSIQEGEQIAIKGASGSGKTTFLNLIAGILKADSGEIMILDQQMTDLSESRRDRLRAKYIGYVFQTFNLLQGYTALENVLMGMMFGQKIDTERGRQLLKQVGLSDRLNYLPRQLSVGQQQRVAVARALANNPKLVLADEPTGNLDRKHAAETIGLIQNICKDHCASLLLVTHDPFILERFGRVEEFSNINKALRSGEPS